MDDVLVVGAGPAGAVAATVLARAGVRVRVIDRAAFPRDKLCGDTINPGTLAMLARLNLAGDIEARGLRIDGMVVTGEGGVSIQAPYPGGLHGIALVRRDLDWILLRQAIAAGATFDDGVTAREAIIADRDDAPYVCGVVVSRDGRPHQLRAPVVIAADGRRSSIAFGLGLSHHPAQPKRWAVGAYFETKAAPAPFGEMHIRSGRYIGVAPVGAGLTNVCVVKAWSGGDGDFGNPPALLRKEIAAQPMLRDRFGELPPVQPPVMLGPLAVDGDRGGIDGLLLAGDAAGFVDPMTGDGLRFAVRGGELAAEAALDALEHGWTGVHARLAAVRSREFAAKWRFNRTLRALVASPAAVHAAAIGASLAPGVVRRLIARAGDCALVLAQEEDAEVAEDAEAEDAEAETPR